MHDAWLILASVAALAVVGLVVAIASFKVWPPKAVSSTTCGCPECLACGCRLWAHHHRNPNETTPITIPKGWH